MDKIEIGKIVKPQGIKGDLKVVLFADNNFDIGTLSGLYVGDQFYKIKKHYKTSDGCVVVSLDNICSLSDAEKLRGTLVFASRNEIKKPENSYFVCDLIGKTAKLLSGKVIGKIFDIQAFGSADVIYISAQKNVLVSHIDGLIKNVTEDSVIFDDKIFGQVAVYED